MFTFLFLNPPKFGPIHLNACYTDLFIYFLQKMMDESKCVVLISIMPPILSTDLNLYWTWNIIFENTPEGEVLAPKWGVKAQCLRKPVFFFYVRLL